MSVAATRRGTVPFTFHANTMNTASPMNAKASLTFESVVCSQIELKRRAASFSRRRSTMCRRPSQYLPSPSTGSDRLSISSNRTVLPSSLLFLSQSNGRPSVSAGPSDTSNQFLRTNTSNNDSKRSRASSTYSLGGTGLENIEERQSLVSMLYWDRSSKSAASKKEESRTSKWSIDFQKDTPQYGTLRSRLLEEYTDCESLFEFIKKTVLVLIKSKAATIFSGLLLILPVVMMCIGVSHLSDCPHQTHLPIYLFVAGIVWTTKLLQSIWHKYRLQQKFLNDEETSSNRNDGHAFIDGLMTSFLVVWFFLGHYWLITIGYPPIYEQPLEAPDVWCHKSVVLGAFASILITYFILIAFMCAVVFLVLLTRYTISKRALTS